MTSDTLRALRAKFRISQTELGRRVGLSQTQISAIEASRCTIPRPLARQIQEAFRASARDEVVARPLMPAVGTLRDVLLVLQAKGPGE